MPLPRNYSEFAAEAHELLITGARSVPPRHSLRLMVHKLALCGALALLGCDRDECEAGQLRCSDNIAETCSQSYSDGSAPLIWVREDCGEGVCRVTGGEAFCAVDDQPDPRCAVGSDQAVCDGATRVSCRHGFAAALEDCSAGEGHCVDTAFGAECAFSSSPTALCPPAAYASACDANTLIHCVDAYVVAREPCGARFCATTPGYPFCASSSEPDPLCPLEPAASRVCDGDVVVECAYGYRSYESPCDPGQRCRASGSAEAPEAFCAKDEGT